MDRLVVFADFRFTAAVTAAFMVLSPFRPCMESFRAALELMFAAAGAAASDYSIKSIAPVVSIGTGEKNYTINNVVVSGPELDLLCLHMLPLGCRVVCGEVCEGESGVLVCIRSSGAVCYRCGEQRYVLLGPKYEFTSRLFLHIRTLQQVFVRERGGQ